MAERNMVSDHDFDVDDLLEELSIEGYGFDGEDDQQPSAGRRINSGGRTSSEREHQLGSGDALSDFTVDELLMEMGIEAQAGEEQKKVGPREDIDPPSREENLFDKSVKSTAHGLWGLTKAIGAGAWDLGVGGTRGAIDMYTGSSKKTPRTISNEEFRHSPEYGFWNFRNPLKTTMLKVGMSSTMSTNEAAQIIKAVIPTAEIDSDEKGNLHVRVDSGEYVVNAPGMSEQDLVQMATQIAYTLPAGRFARVGATAGKQALGLAAGEFAGEATRQTAVNVAGGKSPYSPSHMFLAGLGRYLGETVVPVADYMRKKRVSKELSINPEDMDEAYKNMADADDITENTGVEFSLGQKTGMDKTLETQIQVQNRKEGRAKGQAFMKSQNKELADRVNNFLGEIADGSAVFLGSRRFKSAADQWLLTQKALRSEKTSPIYTDSFIDTNPIDVSDIRAHIESVAEVRPKDGEVRNVLEKVLKQLRPNPTGDESIPFIEKRLEELHNVRLEIGEMIENRNQNSLGRIAKRELSIIKERLTEKMDSASSEYAKARNLFKEMSPYIDAVEKSVVGKVADFNDMQLSSIAEELFGEKMKNMSDLYNARGVVESVDPEAWRDIVRVGFEDRLGDLLKHSLDADVYDQFPKKLKKSLFGEVTNKTGSIFEIALKPHPWEKHSASTMPHNALSNLQYIKNAIELADRGRGSAPLQTMETRADLLDRGVIDSILRFTVSFSRRVLEKRRETAAEIVTKVMFDPEYQAPMKKIRRMDPRSREAAILFYQILRRAESDSNFDKEAAGIDE